MKSKRTYILLALAAAFATGGCVDRAAQQQAAQTKKLITDPVQPVTVTPVSTKTLVQKIEVTGQITTSASVDIGAKNSGRLVGVYVQDGSAVRKGQVIAQQDTSTQQITLQQDMAQVSNARAALTQAIANARIGPQKSTAAVLQAKAQLAQSQAALAKAVNGARPEEKAQADSNVAAAKSTMDTAKRQRDRQRQLLDQGAISQQDFDTAENAYETAESSYQNMLAAQQMSRNQTRPEDIAAARAAVAQAQQNLQSAQDQKKLDSLFTDQVNAAKATLQNTLAVEKMAQQNIADATIRAPFDGVINGKPAQPGAVLGAGGVVANLVGKSGTYFEGTVSENDVATIGTGAAAVVTIDALPGRTFQGHVASISPSASTSGRLFTVRVVLDGYTGDLKPGMFATGDVTQRTIRDAIVVPTVAIVQQNGSNYVYVPQNNKAHLVPVKLGLQEGDTTQVIGLAVGQQVVTTGQNNIGEGTPIRIDKGLTAQVATSVRGS